VSKIKNKFRTFHRLKKIIRELGEISELGFQVQSRIQPLISFLCGAAARGGRYNGATENAGLENAAPDCRGGKRGSSTVWKAEVSVI